MALIKCANCSKEISDKSKKCIHCGSHCILSKIANKLKTSTNDLIGMIVSIVFSILFYIILWGLAFFTNLFRCPTAICFSFIISISIMVIILLTKKISIKHCVPNLLTSIWFYCIFGYRYTLFPIKIITFAFPPIEIFCKMYMLPYLIIAFLFYFIFNRKKS